MTAPDQVKSAIKRLLLDSAAQRNPLTNLLPLHPSNWWPLVEDAFSSPVCRNLSESLLTKAIDHAECSYWSIDGTFRVCLSLLGQPKFNDPPSVRQQFPYTGESDITRVISIRGRSGAVLGLIPAAGEGPSHILHCLQSALPERGLQQVEHIAVDNPSGKLFQELKGALCKLTSVSLDPTHACMHYEQALGKHRSAGSGTLRKFMAKFCGRDPDITANIWGPMFEGNNCPRITGQEQKLREEIKSGSMPARKAQQVLSASDALKVWPTRLQFVEAIAALAAVHSEDLARKIDGTKITVATILYNLTAGDRMEWLFNCLRYRHFLPEAVRVLLPSGTASNEALHAEINAWFRQVQQMHRSTLALKLRIQQLGKLIPHMVALHSPTSRQMPEGHLLARYLGNPLWSTSAWAEWLSQRQVDLPLADQRKSEKRTVADAGLNMRRPAAQRTKKRTPFTLERRPGLSRAGVYMRKPAKIS